MKYHWIITTASQHQRHKENSYSEQKVLGLTSVIGNKHDCDGCHLRALAEHADDGQPVQRSFAYQGVRGLSCQTLIIVTRPLLIMMQHNVPVIR